MCVICGEILDILIETKVITKEQEQQIYSNMRLAADIIAGRVLDDDEFEHFVTRMQEKRVAKAEQKSKSEPNTSTNNTPSSSVLFHSDSKLVN